MIVGVPRELKASEYRVALVPSGAHALAEEGHDVLVEAGAGEGSGFSDEAYRSAGGEIVADVEDLWARSDMIVKVKEPEREEWTRLRRDQVLFTYLHLASSEDLTRALVRSECVAIGYETVQVGSGELPLLTPMSEVAGRMAIQEGARYLERPHGGRGVLLAGVPGVLPGEVVILGGGTVGENAARMAAGLGSHVTVLDVSVQRLRTLSRQMPANVDFLFSNRYNVRDQLRRADLVIGAVLIPGKKAPRVVRRDDLGAMLAGAVIVDVSVDQGGCIETTRPTTHDDPVYTIDGIVHYAVTNMPGAVPRTSTLALTNATFPYVADLARRGWRGACSVDPALAAGVNLVRGAVVHPGVADTFGLELEALGPHLRGPARA